MVTAGAKVHCMWVRPEISALTPYRLGGVEDEGRQWVGIYNKAAIACWKEPPGSQDYRLWVVCAKHCVFTKLQVILDALGAISISIFRLQGRRRVFISMPSDDNANQTELPQGRDGTTRDRQTPYIMWDPFHEGKH